MGSGVSSVYRSPVLDLAAAQQQTHCVTLTCTCPSICLPPSVGHRRCRPASRRPWRTCARCPMPGLKTPPTCWRWRGRRTSGEGLSVGTMGCHQ